MEDVEDDSGKRYALLLPAGEVPEGMEITKRTGTTPYKLVSSVTLPPPWGARVAEKGTKFLLKASEPTHSVHAITSDTLVHCWVSLQQLESWVYEKINGPPA